MRMVPRWLFIACMLAATAVFVAVAVLAWGPWREFFASPARLGVVAASLVATVAACCSDINLSAGRREDRGSRWIFVPFALYSALLTWLPPYCDRRDILTLDGDTLRYAGLVVFIIGGALRVAPMFVLGPRFSALVAIQREHELVTDGLYGVIRHPSFLGAGLAILGWCLVFRSILGLLLMPIAVWLGVARINAEEVLLAAEFGERYAAYRRRTWRLIPWVY
jgi:protein-S-isoprenylcysteine O-methyltransferase Ste14